MYPKSTDRFEQFCFLPSDNSKKYSDNVQFLFTIITHETIGTFPGKIFDDSHIDFRVSNRSIRPENFHTRPPLKKHVFYDNLKFASNRSSTTINIARVHNFIIRRPLRLRFSYEIVNIQAANGTRRPI